MTSPRSPVSSCTAVPPRRTCPVNESESWCNGVVPNIPLPIVNASSFHLLVLQTQGILASWYSLRVSIDCLGYERFTTKGGPTKIAGKFRNFDGSHLSTQQRRPVVKIYSDFRVVRTVDLLTDSQRSNEQRLGILILALEHEEKGRSEHVFGDAVCAQEPQPTTSFGG